LKGYQSPRTDYTMNFGNTNMGRNTPAELK